MKYFDSLQRLKECDAGGYVIPGQLVIAIIVSQVSQEPDHSIAPAQKLDYIVDE